MSDAGEAGRSERAAWTERWPSGRSSEPLDTMSAQAFLAGLGPEHAVTMSDLGVPVGLLAGQRLFSEGGKADRFWLLVSGLVALDVHVPGRGRVPLETLGPGQLLGWSWLDPPYRWHFGAVTREQTEALEFDAAAVRERCDADPGFGYALVRRFVPVLVDRLQATRVRLLDLYAPQAQAPAP